MPLNPTAQLNEPSQSLSGLLPLMREPFTVTTLSPPAWIAQRVTPLTLMSQLLTVTFARSMAATAAPTPIKSFAPKPSRSIWLSFTS